MIRAPSEHSGDLRATCDVVIVGTGPGGSAAAATLAEAGAKVILLDAGKRFLPKEYVPRMQWAHENLFMARGTRVSRGNAFIPIFSAQVVGGGSIVNSAICFRAPDVKLEEWVRDFGVGFADPTAMRPIYEEVERDIQVTRTAEWNGKGNNLIFKKGVDALGWTTGAFMARNAPGCIGCGLCRMGCPIGGKGSMDMNYLRRATAKGAVIHPEAKVERVLVESGRAVGVEGSFGPHRMEIRAKNVLLSGGAFGTPLLLMRSGLGGDSGQLGKNLRLHPSTGTFAFFDQQIRYWDGVTQGYYVHDPAARILLETFTENPEIPFAGLPRTALPPKRHANLAMAGGMVGDLSGGSLTPAGDDAEVHYDVADEDRRTLVESLRRIVQVFFAAGATEVYPGVGGGKMARTLDDALAQLPLALPVTRLALQSSHPHGSARMSADPAKGVVRPDGRVYGVEGLRVADASLFPTSLGVNPQVTIMAFAKVVARNLLAA